MLFDLTIWPVWLGGLVLFFAFVVGHAVADFGLQSAFLAGAKVPPKPGERKGGELDTIWIHALTAHALIHGGVVWLIAGSPLFGLIETGLHLIIDYLKSTDRFNFNIDQILHYSCKVAYVIVIVTG